MHVLIVDDVRTARAVLRGVLQAKGHTVVGEAGTGSEALQMVSQLKPEIVLLDLNLPDISGVQVAHDIMEKCPTPLIVVSGYDDEETIRLATDAGIHAFLSKPIRDDELLRAIYIARARFEDALRLRRLQEAAEKRAYQLSKAHEIIHKLANTSLTAQTKASELLDTVARVIHSAFAYHHVNVFWLDQERMALVVVATAGKAQKEGWLGYVQPLSAGGLLGQVIQEGKPIRAPDVSKEPQFLPCKWMPDTKGELAVPIKIQDLVVGVLDIQSETAGALAKEDQEILEILASHLAAVLDNLRLVSELQERSEQLGEANEMLLAAQEQLVKAERLAAIGQALAAVQHEINNPLTTVLGNIQWLLRNEKGLSEETLDLLRTVERESFRIRDVVLRMGKAEDRVIKYVGNTQMIDLGE